MYNGKNVEMINKDGTNGVSYKSKQMYGQMSLSFYKKKEQNFVY